MKVKKISEEKKVSGKQIITILSLLISTIGAIFTLLYGINQDQYYIGFYIALAALTVLGGIIGFFKKAVGIGVSFVIGIIGFIMTIVLGYGGYDLGLILLVMKV